MAQPFGKKVWQFLKELNTALLCDPVVSLLELKRCICANTYMRMFSGALCVIAKKRKQPGWPSVEEWTGEVWYVRKWDIIWQQKGLKC